ncbi:MAG TPA: iron-sulfur cluster assembly accessory protein [Thermoanaerobaculia bacterium]|nr:iron-sulfur cluster assembly accessory protein [Thermoanaerobaculia bacterium]
MITFTELAKKQILMAIEDEQATGLALRIAVTGLAKGGFQYRMDLVEESEQDPRDLVEDLGEFRVLMDPDSAPKLEGVTVDFVQRLQETGFKFDNPNSPWSSPTAAEVQRVIEDRINPQIASHGGFVTLLDVKDDTAYVSMGGGCQGCGMADVTLKQGIETMILESVPEIRRVLDTTDHAAGTNPYYAGRG